MQKASVYTTINNGDLIVRVQTTTKMYECTVDLLACQKPKSVWSPGICNGYILKKIRENPYTRVDTQLDEVVLHYAPGSCDLYSAATSYDLYIELTLKLVSNGSVKPVEVVKPVEPAKPIESKSKIYLSNMKPITSAKSTSLLIQAKDSDTIYETTISDFEKCQSPVTLTPSACREYIQQKLDDTHLLNKSLKQLVYVMQLGINNASITLTLNACKNWKLTIENVLNDRRSLSDFELIHTCEYPTWPNKVEFNKLPDAKLFNPPFPNYVEDEKMFKFNIDGKVIRLVQTVQQQPDGLFDIPEYDTHTDLDIHKNVLKYFEQYVKAWCIYNMDKVALRRPRYILSADRYGVTCWIFALKLQQVGYVKVIDGINIYTTNNPVRHGTYINGIDVSDADIHTSERTK